MLRSCKALVLLLVTFLLVSTTGRVLAQSAYCQQVAPPERHLKKLEACGRKLCRPPVRIRTRQKAIRDLSRGVRSVRIAERRATHRG